MGDRGAKGALRASALDIDMNPLVIAGDPRECVDVLLRHGSPLAGADLSPYQRLHPLNPLHLDRGHRRSLTIPMREDALEKTPQRRPRTSETERPPRLA